MNLRRAISVIGVGFGLLLFQSAVSVVVPLHPFTPNLLLPAVLVLGVSQEIPIARGGAVAFALGYLLDLFSGNLLGLQTFLSVATFFVARGAGLRLVLRGPSFQAAASFVVAVLVGGASLALRAVFGPTTPFPQGGYEPIARALIPPAVATAIVAPVVIALLNGVGVAHSREART